MFYLLDTNICSYILKRRPATVRARFDEVGPENLCLSTIVLAELYYGAARHPQGETIRGDIDDFTSRLTLLPWDDAAADHYGAIRTELERTGTPIGAMDMLIAAHARSIDATLVSNNARHFRQVSGLRWVDWV
jgi:tRNA(fMet)-specific endonuclease VapC